MSLHPAIGPNRYCGPGAYAILTGLDTGIAAAHLRDLTGKRAIIGTPAWALTKALTERGLSVVEKTQPLGRGAPLSRWSETVSPGVYLVNVTKHWVVVDLHAGEAADNNSVYPRPLDKFGRRRKRVQRWWRIEEAA